MTQSKALTKRLWLASGELAAHGGFDNHCRALDQAAEAINEMKGALRLGIEYDDLLLKFKGPRVLYDGDVAEVDAAYDKWVAATRAAYAKATS